MISPTHEEIAARAYQIWQQRGEPIGTPDEDWFQAEQSFVEPPPNTLTTLARDVGSALGTVAALLGIE